MIVVIHAHPYPSRSRAGRALVDTARSVPDTEVRSLYDLYPEFDIDVAGEQDALARSSLVVWLHPFYWYSVPGVMKHWFDKVLERGWAYGAGGTALVGKRCLWVPTVGGAEPTYAEGQSNLRPFPSYVDPVEQTARFCGMEWETPLVTFDSRAIQPAELAQQATRFRERLLAFSGVEARTSEPEGSAR